MPQYLIPHIPIFATSPTISWQFPADNTATSTFSSPCRYPAPLNCILAQSKPFELCAFGFAGASVENAPGKLIGKYCGERRGMEGIYREGASKKKNTSYVASRCGGPVILHSIVKRLPWNCLP